MFPGGSLRFTAKSRKGPTSPMLDPPAGPRSGGGGRAPLPPVTGELPNVHAGVAEGGSHQVSCLKVTGRLHPSGVLCRYLGVRGLLFLGGGSGVMGSELPCHIGSVRQKHPVQLCPEPSLMPLLPDPRERPQVGGSKRSPAQTWPWFLTK